MKKLFVLISFWAMMVSVDAQLVQFGVNGDIAFDRESSDNWNGDSAPKPDSMPVPTTAGQQVSS